MRRPRALFAALMLLAVFLADGLGFAADAGASGHYPTNGAISQAQQKAATRAGDVAGIKRQLVAVAQKADAAELAVSTAAENYDVAQIRLQSSQVEAQQAQQVANHAINRLDGAQRAVGQLAAAEYRDGGPIADLDVLLSPGGPDAVLERATLMQQVAAGQQRTVHSMDSARVSANALQRQAALALERQQQAAKQMAAARAAAQARAAEVTATLASTQATQQALLAQLAKAQRTTVALESARAAGLRAEAQRRAEQAAAAQAARDAARQANSGGGNVPAPTLGSGSSSGSASAGDAVVAWARARLGLPYLWGGAGPGAYDCSGLTMRAWQQQGVDLPHSAAMQYELAQKVAYSQMRPGDLIFYATDTAYPSSIHHVTIYAGNGMMIEAPHTGAFVRYVPVRWGGEAMPYAGRP